MSTVTIKEAIDIALAYQNTGNLAEAENIFLQIIEFNPNIPDVWSMLGVCQILYKKHESAIKSLQNAIKLKSNEYSYYVNLGEAYKRNGDLENAKNSFLKALELNPNSIDATINLANTLKALGEIKEAIKQYKIALSLDPNAKDALYNLANSLFSIGELDESKNLYLKLVSIDPNNSNVLNNLALIYSKERVYNMAIEYFKKAAELPPKNATIYFNLANTYRQIRDFDNAINSYQEALKLHKNYVEAEINLAFCYLTQKRFNEGFYLYENRIKLINKIAPKMLLYPTLEQIKDKKVLVFTEQGFGDTIMFSRFLPEVSKYVNKLFFVPQKELFSIMKESFKEIEVIDNITNIEFDYSIAIGSLPFLLQISDLNQIKKNEYIFTSKKIELQKDNKKKVGFVFSSNPNFLAAPLKSIEITKLIPIFKIDGVRFYSFQVDSAKNELKKLPNDIDLIDLSPQILDFRDSASFIKEMDAIFCIDTALAHLAGAMGKKTYLLLHFDADWRWGDFDEISYWYENIELLWQKEPENWQEPIAKLKEKIEKLKQLK